MAGEWKMIRIGDAAKINPDTISRDWPYPHIRYLDISSVGAGQIEVSPQWMKLSDAPSRAKRLVCKGDTVLSTVRPNRRSMFFASNPGDDWVISTGFAVLRPNTELLEPRFLYTCVSNQAFTEYLITREKGAAYPAVSPEDIANAKIPFPPLPEQRAIAHILGTLDDKIELNRRMSQTLEEMARAIFKSWFVDFDPVRAKAAVRREHPDWTNAQVSRAACPNLKPEIAELFPDRFVDSELGEIPEGWGVGRLGDVAEHTRRSVQPNSVAPDTPYIALEHMPRRCIALSDWGTAEGIESNKFEFRKGEILFGKLRPYFHKVGVAPVDGVCSTDIAVISPRTPHWFAFVLGVISSDDFVEYTNAGSTGTKMPRTSWTEMARYNIVLSPEALAQAFNDKVQPQVERIITAINESRTLASLRDALLPKLISGEIRVKDAELFLEEQGL